MAKATEAESDVEHLRGVPLTLSTAAAGETRRSFRLVAYTGVPVDRSYGKFAIDLEGVESDASIAILHEHDDSQPIGVATKVEKANGQLVLSGHMLSNPTAREVCANADEGLPYKCSVGIRVLKRDDVGEGAAVKCNGRDLTGPITIARKARLFETSFITCDPADPNTAAVVMHREEKAFMADLTTAPEATEKLRAEATKLERERVAEIRAAYGTTRPAFALDMIEGGKTITEAKAELADVLMKELAARDAKDAETLKAKTNDEALKAKSGRSGIGFSGPEREKAEAVPVEDLSTDERAKREWHSRELLRQAIPDCRVETSNENGARHVVTGSEIYASYLRFEARAKKTAETKDGQFGGEAKLDRTIKAGIEVLRENSERLWTKSGPDYGAFTVKGYIGMLYHPLEGVLGQGFSDMIGAKIPSSQEVETYRFLGQVPTFREWIGNRQRQVLSKYSLTATNKLYELTMVVSKADWKFEKSGQLQMRLGETGRRAALHWDKLITDAIIANTASAAYDGQAFFSASHTLGGDSGTMSNLLTNSDVGALAAATGAAPTATEAGDIINGVLMWFYRYKDDRGEPLNGDAREFVIMVPVAMGAAFRAALNIQQIATGGSNTVKVQDFNVRLVINPRLTSDTELYAFRTDSFFKPFICQELDPIETQFVGAGSEFEFNEDAYMFGLCCRRTVQYGEWAHAIKATVS